MDDLLIRQATLYDGSGADPMRADLAVRAGRIRAIAPSLPEDAKQVIDADGLALMPGIIDSHTHYDAQITWDPYVRPSPALGVTTAVIGNCGFTIAPCRPQDRELTMRNLTQVEGMSFEVLQRGVRWEFQTFAEYLAQLRRTGCAINIAAYVGHSSLRTYVMGAAANQRAATADEIAQMAALVREAMAAGAVGLASSTSPAHNGAGGAPMPSRLASDEEHLALIEAMGESGRGVYMVTKGAQMPVALLEEMAARSRRPVMIAALLHNSTNPDAVFADLDAISAANQRGHRLIGQVSCCPLTMDYTMASPYPVEGLASWKPALGKQGKALCAVLASPAFRNGVRQELAQPSAFRLFNGEWDKVHVVEVAQPRHRELEQRSVRAIAAAPGQGPARCDARPRARRRPGHHLHRAAAQQRRGRGGAAAQPPAQPDLAVGRRRAPHVLQRRRVRAAPAGALGARARGDAAAGCGAAADQSERGDLWLAGARVVARGVCGGSVVVRSGHGGAGAQPSGVRSARWGAAAAHRCGGGAWGVGQWRMRRGR